MSKHEQFILPIYLDIKNIYETVFNDIPNTSPVRTLSVQGPYVCLCIGFFK